MKDCDISKHLIDRIITDNKLHDEAMDREMDSRLAVVEGKGFWGWFQSKIGTADDNSYLSRNDINNKIQKEYGSKSERIKLAVEIRTKIGSMSSLSEAILEEIENKIVFDHSGMNKTFFKTDPDTGISQILLYKLPISSLKSYLSFVDAWIGADPAKWDSLYYRAIRLGWGVTKKLRFTENSGAYNRLWKATLSFADKQAFHINRFNKSELAQLGSKSKEKTKKVWKAVRQKGKYVLKQVPRALREDGAQKILNTVEGLYEKLSDIEVLSAWENSGVKGSRSAQIGKQKMIELFTWMMHGRVVYIDKKTAETTFLKDTADRKNELLYKDGANWYIYTQWAPTNEQYEDNTVKFSWQKPVTLKYDVAKHGTLKDHTITDFKGRKRDDTFNLIKNLPPVFERESSLQELLSQASALRAIGDEAFAWFNVKTEESFKNVLASLLEHFPNKTIDQIKDAVLNQKFKDINGRMIWSEEELSNLNYLEDSFTKHSLDAPFKATMPSLALAGYKGNFFPYIYMPNQFVFLIDDAIDTMSERLEKVESTLATAEGRERQQLVQEKVALTMSIEKQKEMKKELLGFVEDIHDGDKMVTRTRSKHFKHISNAYDVLKSRTDKGVFQSYLEHSARSIERNNLTAEFISALNMIDPKFTGVKDAMVSLYKGTLGQSDARSLVFGLNISDDNLPDTAVSAIKNIKRFLNLLLSGPGSAVTQYYGHIEKFIKMGLDSTIDAFTYVDVYEKELQKILDDSGILSFDDFFNNNIITTLEKLEADDKTIYKMVKIYAKFIKNKNNKSYDDLEADLNKEMTELWGVADLKWENILSEEELKTFRKKMISEKISRITNKFSSYAIANHQLLSDGFVNNPSGNKILNTIIKMPLSGYAKFITVYQAFRQHLKSYVVIGAAEMRIRTVSFVLGVRAAQRIGRIRSDIDVHKLTPNTPEYLNAIKYGRMATNLQFDFSMSRQGVGEIYRSALGSFLGGFSLWKTQKFAEETDLWVTVMRQFNNNAVPVQILKSLGLMLQTNLASKNPQAAKLQRWFLTNFLIEGAFQALYIFPLMPQWARTTVYSLGLAKSLRGSGSPLGGIVWGLILLAVNAFNDDDDVFDDAKEVERMISYQLKNLPGVGIGYGMIYDLMMLFGATQMTPGGALEGVSRRGDLIIEDKTKGLVPYVAPEPVSRGLIKLLKDLTKEKTY